MFFRMIYFQASILDLHSGALSYGENFVNIYKWVVLIELVILWLVHHCLFVFDFTFI
jgi:hypothetical protein